MSETVGFQNGAAVFQFSASNPNELSRQALATSDLGPAADPLDSTAHHDATTRPSSRSDRPCMPCMLCWGWADEADFGRDPRGMLVKQQTTSQSITKGALVFATV